MSGLEGLLAGRTLVKRYRIEEVIGRGGFAVVYRATDQSLGRTVAVKVITTPAPDPETRAQNRERFQQEARAAASLSHPNVVTVHDFGTDPTLDIDFLVMEFLHGEDLATYLGRHGRPPLDLALSILADAAKGLAIGHRAGLVHRDVKPGNLFLAEPHGHDPFRVCVLDFGIARASAEDRTVTSFTQGGIALSPAYASPEQARGERQLTPASDVFSLGVVGYQLLTGEKPFAAERGNDPAHWVPARSVGELNPSVPESVEAVIRRAMSFAPEDRFPDAAAMGLALENAVQASPLAAGAVAAPAAASPRTEVLEDATMLQPTPSAAPRPRPVAPPPERRRPSFAKWGVALLLLGGVGVLGALALGDGGEGGSPPATEIAIPEADSPDDAVAEVATEPPVERTDEAESAVPSTVTGGQVTLTPGATQGVAPGAPVDSATGTPATAAAPPPASGQPAPPTTPAAAAQPPAEQRPRPAARQPADTTQQRRPAAQQPVPADSTPPRLLGEPVRKPEPRPASRDTTARPRSDTSAVALPDTVSPFGHQP